MTGDGPGPGPPRRLVATRRGPRTHADARRVVAQLFVPGHHLESSRHGQVSTVVAALLALDEDEVAATLAEVRERLGGRHRDLHQVFERHADRIAHRLDPTAPDLSDECRQLLGATFTAEYALEGAAVCNPSMVPAPDQVGTAPGRLRFVMSVRQIGEGHQSSIGFRTGTVDGNGGVELDHRSRFSTEGTVGPALLDAADFRDPATDLGGDADAARWALDRLPERFTADELAAQLSALEAQGDTRRDIAATAARLRDHAARSYAVTFPPEVPLGERVLRPATATESHGVEDARFVRFTDDDGSARYHATYVGYDGARVSQQLLTTTDLSTFHARPLVGAGADGKGLALFPRRIRGRFAALSRHDGSTNSLVWSDGLGHWSGPIPLRCPIAPWEVLQRGNCGSPIETAAGWLVLTHGVGPVRSYAIGAWLLALDDPSRVIGHLREPLLRPLEDERDGYVPNVVYSCGGLVHRGTLVIPFGVGDAAIDFASVPLGDLLGAMVRTGR